MEIVKVQKDLAMILDEPMFSWINEESTKRMSEVVRDVFPKATRNEIAACLEMFWEKDDTPETLYKKLMDSKVA